HAVYVPAGIGVVHVNREHAAVRDVCLAVRPDAVLYADQPYCEFRADTVLPPELAVGRERRLVELAPRERERKAEAIACYAGEIAKLERAFGPITQPGRLANEIFYPAA